MKKSTIIKGASTMVIFKGVDTVIDSGVDLMVPKSEKFYQKAFTKIGSKAISLAITHAIQKEINEVIDFTASIPGEIESIKMEALAAAMDFQEEEENRQNEVDAFMADIEERCAKHE